MTTDCMVFLLPKFIVLCSVFTSFENENHSISDSMDSCFTTNNLPSSNVHNSIFLKLLYNFLIICIVNMLFT